MCELKTPLGVFFILILAIAKEKVHSFIPKLCKSFHHNYALCIFHYTLIKLSLIFIWKHIHFYRYDVVSINIIIRLINEVKVEENGGIINAANKKCRLKNGK